MPYLMIIAVIIALILIALILNARRFSGPSLKPYDKDHPVFASASPSEGLTKLTAHLKDMFRSSKGAQSSGNAASGWTAKREKFDEGGLSRTDLKAEYRPAELKVDGHIQKGSWTLVEGYDPNKRILYMHGGAFTVGSDISHRPLSVALAKRTGAAVFVPNYRLMPENTRQDAIKDAKAAYNWVVENGPDGPAPAKWLALSGDSAGGNLALMLANWARKHAKRQADGVVAFSPITDATLSSPSMRKNAQADLMLGPMLGKIIKLPRFIVLPALPKQYGMHPTHPEQSPIFDDLSDLPPTLILASRDEMLHDDGARYAAKMQASGSTAQFQSWGGGLPHVWPIFDNLIAEANQALDGVGDFLNGTISS